MVLALVINNSLLLLFYLATCTWHNTGNAAPMKLWDWI